MNKKLAILLSGIHFKQNYNHWMSGKYYTIDFERDIDGFFENVVSYFENNGWEIDFFYSTYFSSKESILYERLQPKKRILSHDLNYHKPDFRVASFERINRLLEVLLMVDTYQDTNKKYYDQFLVTRFDLKYMQKLDDLNHEEFKFNFHCQITEKYKGKNGVDDAFFIFPKYHLKKFINAILDHPTSHLHDINNYLNLGKSQTNYLSEGIYFKGKYDFILIPRY